MPPLRRGEETAGAPINASTSQCIIHHSLHRCLSVSHYLPLREYMAHWKPTTPWHHRQYHHRHHHKHHHAAHSPPSALDGTPTLPTSLPPYLPTSLPPLHTTPSAPQPLRGFSDQNQAHAPHHRPGGAEAQARPQRGGRCHQEAGHSLPRAAGQVQTRVAGRGALEPVQPACLARAAAGGRSR